GSDLPEKLTDDDKRQQWITDAFAQTPTAEKLAKVVTVRLAGNELHEFQRKVGASKDDVTLVRAGCGSGTKVGAYHWAAMQQPGRRLYFCYPTAGTATEGFRGSL